MEPGTDFKYKRLTRTSARAGVAIAVRSRTSLWLGPDHLLSVESDNFRENYKRFYFRDIQAILVQKTDRFRTWNIILGMIIAGALVFILALFPKGEGWTSDTIGFVCFFGFILGLFVLILVLHLISGPTCKTFLRTAVQIEEFPSLCRIKTTRRVLGQIRPLIVAAQGGELSPDAIAAQMREWTAPTPTATVAPAETPTVTVAPPDDAENDPKVPPRLSP